MHFFNKQVFLCFTLILSGWVQTTMADDKMSDCPDIASISQEQEKELATLTITCANAALEMLNAANDVTSTVAVAEMTIKALNLLIEADDADAPGLDDAEEKLEEVRVETVKKLKSFIDKKSDDCGSTLAILSKLDSGVRDILKNGGTPCKTKRSGGNCSYSGKHCICEKNDVNACYAECPYVGNTRQCLCTQQVETSRCGKKK